MSSRGNANRWLYVFLETFTRRFSQLVSTKLYFISFNYKRCYFTCVDKRDHWVKSMTYQVLLNNCPISSQYQPLPNTLSIFNRLNLNSQPISQFFLNKISMWRRWSDIDIDRTLRESRFTFLARALSFRVLRGHWSDIDIDRTLREPHFTFLTHASLAGYWEDIDQTSILTKHWENPDLRFWQVLVLHGIERIVIAYLAHSALHVPRPFDLPRACPFGPQRPKPIWHAAQTANYACHPPGPSWR